MASAITRILYPTDFSTGADAALEPVKAVARFHAEVLVLHVIEPLPLPPEGFVLGATSGQDLMDEARREAMARLDGLARVLKDEGVAVTTRVVIGPVVSRIIEAAKEEGADLIALGTHGRTGFASVVLGSVADKVVRLATCPLLTVGHRARPEEEPR